MRVRSAFIGAAIVVAPTFAFAQRAVVVHVTGEPGAIIQQADTTSSELEWNTVCTSPCTARVPPNTYYRSWQSLRTPSTPVWLSNDVKEVSMTVTAVADTTRAGTVLTAVGGGMAIVGGVTTLVGAVMELGTSLSFSFSLCFSPTPCPQAPAPDHTAADFTTGVGVAALVTGLVVLIVGVTLRRNDMGTTHEATLERPWTRVSAERTAPIAPPVIGFTVLRLAF